MLEVAIMIEGQNGLTWPRWQDREHHLFGFNLLEPKTRFNRFEEGMEVVKRLLQSLDLDDLDGLKALAKAIASPSL